MRTCREYEDMISAFIDGALAEHDRAALMEHMAACPACQEYFDQQIALHDALLADAEAIQPPEDLASDVMARVRFTPQEKRKKAAVHWQRWAALAACCAIAALALWRGGAGSRQVNVASSAADRSVSSQAESVENTGRAAGGAGDVADDAAPEIPEPAPEPDDTLAAPTPPPKLDNAPPEDAAAGHFEDPDGQAAPQAAVSDEGKTADTEQRTFGTDAPKLGSAPAADTPVLTDGTALMSNEPEAAKAPHTILTASPAAAAWVEETLGLPWTAGAHYELTAREYDQLRETLEAAGEDFTEQPGDEGAEEFLLIAENSSETD